MQVRAHPLRLRRFVLQKALLFPGGGGQKLDDRPGDKFTDGVCAGGKPHKLDISLGGCTRAE